ncbi:MAG: putative toxin-antitoxin system toxin component, PIN family [Dysgonamonadaceae bacterium]|jgi:putative PIN family toxin of toxin-antitoxin system|nr:putative toxin-antitoxin system toxin component, PIN family [Dysgonamonadaceae bacterium]
MKIVLDTNCLLVALPRNSTYRWIWDAFRNGKFSLCYTTEILHEYEELLSRFYSSSVTTLTMEILLNSPNIYQTTVFYQWNLIFADVDDNKFVDCALMAGADYIVSNDKHFNILKQIDFPPIKIVGIETFKDILHNINLL